MTHSDASKIAQKALAAYDKVLETVEEIRKLGPPIVRGTTVMKERIDGRYQCSECQREGRAENWKFCAYCGAEIIRFDKESPDHPLQFEIVVSEEKR